MCLLASACRPNVLNLLSGFLAFSSPDDPAAVTQLDAGVVTIDFGQVLVGSTKTLTLAAASVGSSVTLGEVTAVQAETEFSLPFVPGTLVEGAPSQITASFTPTSAGAQSALLQLTAHSPGIETVLFELSGIGVANELSVAPNPINFGEVELNQSQSVALTITNHSPLPESLAIASLQGQDADRFSLGAPSSTALTPGGSATLNVSFVPLVDGAAAATFAIGSTSASTGQPVTVSLTGTGIDSWIQVTSPLEFGFVQLGDTIVKSAVIRNAGSYTTLHLVAPAPVVTQPSGTVPFSVAATFPAVPVAIAPGQSVLVPILFAPTNLDAFSGTLLLATDDPLNEYPAVELDGYGGGPSIACLPILGFGPVALGTTALEDSYCLNVGTKIPSLPKLGLQIAQKDLSTDNSAFVPTIVLSDGGLAGSGDSVSLLAGQQALIRVAFRPEDAGVFESHLAVPSNDIGDLDAGTQLLAQGGLSGSCFLQAAPMQLSFGEVPVGARGVLQFELSNTSQVVCTPQLGIAPDSDPAFSLPDGGRGTVVLTYPGNPNGQPSSVILEAEFAPATAEAAAIGKIDVTDLNALQPVQAISLSGISPSACLAIEPPELDFGVVGFSATTQQICVADNARFMAVNQCTVPLIVSELAINSALSALPQFSLQSGLQLPLTLAPGEQASFEASFVPTSAGAKVGAITLASSEFPNDPFLITLQGDAELIANRTDTFVVPAHPKKVDLLWVLDEDDDAPQVATVASLLPQLIDTMNQDQLDYQIAITSTDTCDAGNSDRGSFEPCDHCLFTAATTPTFVTPATTDAGAVLVDLFSFFDIPPQLGFCEKLNGDEHFFDSMADAFSPALLSEHNAGFIRGGAYLAVVLVNGDAEDDGNGAGMGSQYLTSLAQVTTLLQGLKPDPTMVSVSYINFGAGGLNNAQKIGQLVEATGGIQVDTSGLANWAPAFLNLFAYTEGGAFSLTLTPTSVYQIQVDVDGIPNLGWTYDASSNQIVFSPGNLPPQGAVVTVTYGVGCP